MKALSNIYDSLVFYIGLSNYKNISSADLKHLDKLNAHTAAPIQKLSNICINF
jgi:hypothetical protein